VLVAGPEGEGGRVRVLDSTSGRVELWRIRNGFGEY